MSGIWTAEGVGEPRSVPRLGELFRTEGSQKICEAKFCPTSHPGHHFDPPWRGSRYEHLSHMKTILTIRDKDFGLDFPDLPVYKERRSSRAVVLDGDGKIALLHVTKKNFYKLPGGGVEEGEKHRRRFASRIIRRDRMLRQEYSGVSRKVL